MIYNKLLNVDLFMYLSLFHYAQVWLNMPSHNNPTSTFSKLSFPLTFRFIILTDVFSLMSIIEIGELKKLLTARLQFNPLECTERSKEEKKSTAESFL